MFQDDLIFQIRERPEYPIGQPREIVPRDLHPPTQPFGVTIALRKPETIVYLILYIHPLPTRREGDFAKQNNLAAKCADSTITNPERTGGFRAFHLW